MQVEQWQSLAQLPQHPQYSLFPNGQLLLALGSREALCAPGFYERLREQFPQAMILGASTAGEICGTQVSSGGLVLTQVQFAHTRLQARALPVSAAADSYWLGRRLVEALPLAGLRHLMIFADGLLINGSQFTAGLTQALPAAVSLSGGLAGDGQAFGHTFTLCNAPPQEGQVVALGLYGDAIRVTTGSQGGWQPFGPERLITRAEGNLLFELDGQNALGLYKRYLAEQAEGLPATALLFPLAIRPADSPKTLVRTILGIDETLGAMRFAGDMPVGHFARLMNSNKEKLIEGAEDAAQQCQRPSQPHAQWALLVSCVGRKMVLQQRVEEEVEAVRDILGPAASLAGFYSYGEIAPLQAQACSEFHNQTMTITSFYEQE